MDKDKTIPFDNTEDTLRMSVDKTLRMDANASSEKTGVSLKTTKGKKKTMNFFDAGNDSFLLNGKTYLVVETLSDSSGEAQVYLLENNGEKYVLKLYYPNFSPKLDLLEIIAGMNTEYVVRLFDYGIMTMGDSTRTFELMEYLSGGDLEACQLPDDKEQIFRKIAFASASSLRECHKHGIIHKDVKPTNFFFRDETRQQLVLGDFGISSLTEGEDQMHKTTQARTPVYAAPEMYTNVINGEVELTYKVDYY
ncbi:protein kinase family protein, partial [Bacteroides sp. OttesenSCG-928-D19]|nr:protein kinase family protein [Bacteroides sp. OttesenSCG-928-D19]